MKASTLSAAALAALLAAISGPRASAGLFSDSFDALVVAERAKDAPRDAGGPGAYVAYDGGLIEAGDPEAGDHPPAAPEVRRDIESALASQGYVAGAGWPVLAITYHWGVIRGDREEARVPYTLRKNFRARVELVSTQQEGAEVENHFLSRINGGGQNLGAGSPVFLSSPLDAVLGHAKVPRIFVIVSAYDLRAPQPRLVWRTKLSAQEDSGEMYQVIPALISAGAPFLGKDLGGVKAVSTRLASPQGAAAESRLAYPASPAQAAGAGAIQAILSRETDQFSGGWGNAR